MGQEDDSDMDGRRLPGSRCIFEKTQQHQSRTTVLGLANFAIVKVRSIGYESCTAEKNFIFYHSFRVNVQQQYTTLHQHEIL